MNSKFSMAALIYVIIPLTLFSQREKNLSSLSFSIDTVKEFRIKIDGGCGFYKFDNSETFSSKHVFIISAHKIGFFAIKEQKDYIYVKQQSVRHLSNGSYEERFAGQGFNIILTTHSKKGANQIERIGLLEIYNKSKKIKIQVEGIIDYEI